MRAETLVCSRCVAMPGLVRIERSRKEDMVNASTGTTHKRGYVAQPEAFLPQPTGLRCTLSYRFKIRRFRIQINIKIEIHFAVEVNHSVGRLETLEEIAYLSQ